MGETGFHVAVIFTLYDALEYFYQDEADVLVAADMFLYYEQGNPRACRAPDVMVSKGVGKHYRRSFRVWEENAVPRVIFEITSGSTRREDEVEKPAVYAQLRVLEYFLFDPEGDYLDPRLQGFRLFRGKYQRLTAAADGSLLSRELGLRIVAEGFLLRLIDAKTGERLLTQAERADAERERADAERERADAERERADAERERADAERKLADAHQKRANEERERAEASEAEVARLRAELARQKGKKP
jgi:Uma2 family endonuclease